MLNVVETNIQHAIRIVNIHIKMTTEREIRWDDRLWGRYDTRVKQKEDQEGCIRPRAIGFMHSQQNSMSHMVHRIRLQ